MSTTALLRAQHEAKVKKAMALLAKYPAGQRMPAGAAQQFDSLIAEAERLSAQISALTASEATVTSVVQPV